MIKKINSIKKFGIFKSYRRSGTIPDFDKVNIIYGWNYSGKTTLSRIFQCIEQGRLNSDYLNSEFEIEDEDGNKIDHTSVDSSNLEIKVFNSDFIRDNIHLDGKRFNPILLLGKDTKEARDRILNNEKRLKKAHSLRNKVIDEKQTIQDDLEEGLTERASFIKETLQIVQPFSKVHLRKIFDEIKSQFSIHIKSDETSKTLLNQATVSESEKLGKIDTYEPDLSLTGLIEEATILLRETPELSDTISYLVENPNVANWIEKGIPLHEEKSECKFCGNTLDQERLNRFRSHFSEDLKNHKRSIDRMISNIKIAEISHPTHQKQQFYQSLRNDFEEIKNEVISKVHYYNSNLKNLIRLLLDKKQSPFKEIKDLNSVNDITHSLEESITEYNTLIVKNEQITAEFEEKKLNAIEELKKHYTAKFIEKIQYAKNVNRTLVLEERRNILKDFEVKLKVENDQLEAQISKAHLGKEKLNDYIHKFLGREEIRVVVEKDENENDQFRLKRNDDKAVNLSEGEKTAIAFSFFLTKLLESTDLKKVIVYIDDPISSLDSNHIFQINAILKEFFFSKEKEDHEKLKLLDCDQLFLSTHSFDFFNLLTELPNLKQGGTNYFFVKRLNDSEATIDKLPKSIKIYSSEYHYLFKLIHDFYASDEKDIDSSIILPNVVRRFTELYSYSRIPGDKNYKVDYRVNKIWGREESKRILKVCHYFSHGNSIERMSKHNEFICDIENAVSDLINLLKTHDELHYKELKRSFD